MSFRAKPSEVEAATQPGMLSGQGQVFNTAEIFLGFATECLDFRRHDERKSETFRSAQHDSAFLGVFLDIREIATRETAKRLDILRRTFFDYFLR